MPFKDTKEGQTHSYNDGCGEPAHNQPIEEKCRKVAEKIVDLTGYGQALHVNDILPDLRELIENLLEQERKRLGWKTHDCSEMLSTEIENALEQERKRMSEEVEKLKLQVPNPYGDWVKVPRVNMLLERAKAIINK